MTPAGEGIVGDDEVAKAKQGALRSQPFVCCVGDFLASTWHNHRGRNIRSPWTVAKIELVCRGHHCSGQANKTAKDRASRAAACSRVRSRGALEPGGGFPCAALLACPCAASRAAAQRLAEQTLFLTLRQVSTLGVSVPQLLA